jgi:tetratricopeptide (TPR) repeat protein
MDALAASFGTPADMRKKWTLLGEMYPDHYPAFANLAHFIYVYEGRFDEAITIAGKAVSPHYPRSGNTHYLLGTLHLANGNPRQAQIHLDNAKAVNAHNMGLRFVELAASERRFADADKALSEVRLSGVPTNDVGAHRVRIALAVDRGRWREALQKADEAEVEASNVSPLASRIYRSAKLSLQSIATPGTEFGREVDAYARIEQAALRDPENRDRPGALFGDTALATRMLANVSADADVRNYRYVADMAALAQAQIALNGGDATAALAALTPRVDGAELYLLHVGLRDAQRAAGALDRAAAEAQWLAQHRGRAYAEFNADETLKALNVAESNLAVLSEAEIADAQGDVGIRAQKLTAFLRLWPEAELPAPLRRRAEALLNSRDRPQLRQSE